MYVMIDMNVTHPHMLYIEHTSQFMKVRLFPHLWAYCHSCNPDWCLQYRNAAVTARCICI